MQLSAADTKMLDAIVAAIPDLMFLMDEEGIYRNVYAKGKEHLLFKPVEKIIGRTAYDLFEEAKAALFTDVVVKAIATGTVETIEYPLKVGKKTFMFEARVVPLVWQQSERKFALIIVREITARYEEEQKSRLVEQVFEEATEGMLIYNADRIVIKVNASMLQILEREEEEVHGKHLSFFYPMVAMETVQEIKESMAGSDFWHDEVELDVDGKPKLVWLSANAVRDGHDAITNFLIMATDISELRRSRDQLEFMANHDILTGLPNRVLLFDRLEHAISRLTRVGGMGAVLFMDVDNFKDVNDNLGHHIGDQLLVGIAQRLNAAIRSSDTVGRLGGDEFLMIAENIGHIDEVLVVIQKVRELFVTPFMIEENEIDVRLSIGIALIPDDGHDAEMLVNAADKAMYAVKKRGRDGFEFYSKHFSMLSHEFFRIQRAIRQAIREDAFVMVYQPQFSIFDGRLSGVEALLRSTHKELKDVPVEKVISIAEESGTIFEISKFVFSAVCEQIAQWSVLSTLPIRIAINLSRLELGNEALVDTVRGNLEACSVVPKTVEFEITESTLMKSSSQARKNIEVLRDLGCNFSIDDFGTGYSSLSNLKEFNLDKLKIDKMFIDSLETDENDQVIVSATISMAKKLGLTVLAEGVETAEQVNLLKKFGCDEVQGFFFSKPVSAEEMTCLLKAVNG